MTEANSKRRSLSGRFDGASSETLDAINVSVGFDKRLWRQDIEGSLAHVDMLAQEGIISSRDASQIKQGLQQIQEEMKRGQFEFKASLEDIHMNVEFRLHELIGAAAGRLHTARSRNDQVVTDFRLWTRERCDLAIDAIQALILTLLDQAESGIDIVMPGLTHLQTAQPITWGHHMMAYVEMLGRDWGRFRDARQRMNECPLGAAALAGTSFPINRDHTAQSLSFDRPMANSIDAVSDRDFALEYLSAAAITSMHLSRLADEIVLWCSDPYQFIRLNDAFTTGSSIMPQKRNPDGAELVRAKTGRITGSFIALLTILKGLPLAYSKDLQEDKEQTFDGADNLELSLAVINGMLQNLTPIKENLRQAAANGFSTATDLADWLVREVNMPFREAHIVVSDVVKLADKKRLALSELPLADLRKIYGGFTEEAQGVLSPENSVQSRISYGGTAPARVREQIAIWRETLT